MPAAAPAKSRAGSRDVPAGVSPRRRHHRRPPRHGSIALRRFGDRVSFENRSIFDLRLPSASFDLVVCRHVLQAIPHADRAISELARVAKRGGWLHLIAEDYLMINFEPGSSIPTSSGSKARAGSAAPPAPTCESAARLSASCRGSACRTSRSTTSIIDPLRVPRETFAAIWKAWRDGYADAVSAHTSISREVFLAHFEDMIATIERPDGYGVWHVPVIAAQIGKVSWCYELRIIIVAAGTDGPGHIFTPRRWPAAS